MCLIMATRKTHMCKLHPLTFYKIQTHLKNTRLGAVAQTQFGSARRFPDCPTCELVQTNKGANCSWLHSNETKNATRYA